MTDKFLQPRPRKLGPLGERRTRILEAIKRGAKFQGQVISWLIKNKSMSLPSSVIESDLRTLQRRGLITSERGMLKAVKAIE